MELKKLHNSFSEEELLELLESEKEKPEEKLEYKNDVLYFLSVYNIKEGDNRVPNRTIYELYKAWSNDPLNQRTFYRELAGLLPRHPNSKATYYLINESAINLTAKAYKLLQEDKIDVTKSPRYRQNFELFLKETNLKPGNYKLESFILYKIYDNWHYSKKSKAKYLGKYNFIHMLKLYFKKSRIGSTKLAWFSVDKSILNHIDEQQLERIRTAYHEKQKKNKKK